MIRKIKQKIVEFFLTIYFLILGTYIIWEINQELNNRWTLKDVKKWIKKYQFEIISITLTSITLLIAGIKYFRVA